MEKPIYEIFDEMIEEASLLPNGMEKINALEEAVAFAEENSEFGLAFYGRLHLSEAYNSYGKYEKFLQSFFWCLDVYDLNRDVFESYDILWQYKWVLESLDKSPTLTLEEIEAVYEDMKRRYQEEGYSLRPFYQYKTEMYLRLQDEKNACESFEQYLQSVRDDMSDCRSCELQFEAFFYLQTNQDAKGIEIAESLLTEEYSCGEIPQKTYASLLLPLYNKGEVKEAVYMQQRGYFLIHQNPNFLFELSQHLLFLSLTSVKQALSLFKKHIDMAEESFNIHNKFHFFLYSWFLLEIAEQKKIYVEFEKEAFEMITNDIAQSFDERNGNNTYATIINNTFSLLKK